MKQRALVSLAAFSALVFSTGGASAQEDRGPRLRLGVSAEGGPFIVADVATVGVVGAQAQVGFQLSNLFGVYVAATGGLVVGKWSGLTYAAALMVELTFNHAILVGAGAEIGDFIASEAGFQASGALRGGRIHVAWCPSCTPEGGKLRDGFTVGVDVRLLGGSSNFFAIPGGEPAASTAGSPFIVSPMLNVGYLFF